MISSIVSGIGTFFTILEMLIIVNAIMSWFIPPGTSGFSRLIGGIVDPIMEPFSKFQQKLFPNLPIDFSPIIVLLILDMLKTIILRAF